MVACGFSVSAASRWARLDELHGEAGVAGLVHGSRATRRRDALGRRARSVASWRRRRNRWERHARSAGCPRRGASGELERPEQCGVGEPHRRKVCAAASWPACRSATRLPAANGRVTLMCRNPRGQASRVRPNSAERLWRSCPIAATKGRGSDLNGLDATAWPRAIEFGRAGARAAAAAQRHLEGTPFSTAAPGPCAARGRGCGWRSAHPLPSCG